MMRRVAVRAILLALALLVVAAGPASAHGIGGTEPTNYETTLTRVEPRVTGVARRGRRPGQRPAAQNDTDHDRARARLRGRAVPAGRPARRVREPPLAGDVPQPVADSRCRRAALRRSRSRGPSGRRCRTDGPRPGTTTARTTWAADRPPVVQERSRSSPRARPVDSRAARPGTHDPRARPARVGPAAVALAVRRRSRSVLAALVVGLSRTRRVAQQCSASGSAALVLSRGGATCSGSGTRAPRRPAPSSPRASTRSWGSRSASVALGWMWRRGAAASSAVRARRRDLPVRRRRPRRRHDARPLPGAEHVLGVVARAPGERSPSGSASGSRRPPRSASGHDAAGRTPRRPSPRAVGTSPRHQLSSAHPSWSSGSTWMVACAISCRGGARAPGRARVRVGARRRPSRARWRRPSPT